MDVIAKTTVTEYKGYKPVNIFIEGQKYLAKKELDYFIVTNELGIENIYCQSAFEREFKLVTNMKTHMIFAPKRAKKKIVFDDYQDNTEEFQSYWAEMCSKCHNKYKSILGQRASIGAIGICSVKGCENEANYYVDFDEKEITFLDM